MAHRALSTDVDRTLQALGLFLMLIVAWLADRGYSAQQTIAGWLCGFLARRAVGGIAIIGWLVDRLPLPAAPGVAARAFSKSAARHERCGATSGGGSARCPVSVAKNGGV
jgi:hypothetical protein